MGRTLNGKKYKEACNVALSRSRYFPAAGQVDVTLSKRNCGSSDRCEICLHARYMYSSEQMNWNVIQGIEQFKVVGYLTELSKLLM